MRIKIIFDIIKKYFLIATKGRLNYAISQGMNCGKGCIVSSGTDFGSEPYLITLHNNVRLSSSVAFITHDGSVHTIVSSKKYRNTNVHKYGKIEIDDNTFIGARATIMPNVYIGKNCIIGAGALVTHSIPDNSIAVGVPAKIIGDTWNFAEKTINSLPENWDNTEYKENTKNYLLKTIPAPLQNDIN
ncbi:acyltransferase [Lachnospiraceae bacterium KK002]